MKLAELKAITAKAQDGTADSNDIAIVCTAMFESFSAKFSAMQKSIDALHDMVLAISANIELVQRQTLSPLYQGIMEDDLEEEEAIEREGDLEEDAPELDPLAEEGTPS